MHPSTVCTIHHTIWRRTANVITTLTDSEVDVNYLTSTSPEVGSNSSNTCWTTSKWNGMRRRRHGTQMVYCVRNTTEENSSIFSLIWMHCLPSARACRQNKQNQWVINWRFQLTQCIMAIKWLYMGVTSMSLDVLLCNILLLSNIISFSIISKFLSVHLKLAVTSLPETATFITN